MPSPGGITVVDGMRVYTAFQYFGWIAVDDDRYDGPGSPIGRGQTEAEAIEDLKEQILDRAEMIEARRFKSDEYAKQDAEARGMQTNHAWKRRD